MDRIFSIEKLAYPRYMQLLNQGAEDYEIDRNKITINQIADIADCEGRFVFYVGQDWYILGCESGNEVEILDLASEKGNLNFRSARDLYRFLLRFSTKTFKADARQTTSYSLLKKLEKLGYVKIISEDPWKWGRENFYEIEFVIKNPNLSK